MKNLQKYLENLVFFLTWIENILHWRTQILVSGYIYSDRRVTLSKLHSILYTSTHHPQNAQRTRRLLRLVVGTLGHISKSGNTLFSLTPIVLCWFGDVPYSDTRGQAVFISSRPLTSFASEHGARRQCKIVRRYGVQTITHTHNGAPYKHTKNKCALRHRSWLYIYTAHIKTNT